MTPDRTRMRVGIAGCGNIARAYARDIAGQPDLAIAGFVDRHPDRADDLASEFGGLSGDDLQRLIVASDLIVNLTPPDAHVAITAAALDAGRHVFSEKPLALTSIEAHELVELASSRGVRLGCAPA